MTKDFTSLDLQDFYYGEGDLIVKDFVIPVLSNSVRYDRLTGYFNTNGLLGIAPGLENLYRNGGKMRLVIGMHDVPSELIASIAVQDVISDELIDEYKKRLLSEIGFLESESKKSSLAAVAWLMKLGYLEITIAAPRSAAGIFHHKRMIFVDGEGNVIAGTGSLNETGGGHNNSEEMFFQYSWQNNKVFESQLVKSFEDIWNGKSSEVVVRKLDIDFAIEILERMDSPINPFAHVPNLSDHYKNENQKITLLEYFQTTPQYATLNTSRACLYPHQERVFLEALREFPVRKILADEVGLGKTLEAGSIISYLLRSKNVSEVLIVAPAGLVRQWLEEMQMHFELQFWRWDPTTKGYFDVNEVRFSNRNSDSPGCRIISAQWLRSNEEWIRNQNIDLLVVDEAHAARVRSDASGVTKTQLWKCLNHVCSDIPNLLLLSATPMQLDPMEFHGLLQLIGLNDFWKDFRNYEKSLHVISSENDAPTMQQGTVLLGMVKACLEGLQPKVVRSLFSFLDDVSFVTFQSGDSVSRAELAKKHFKDFQKLLIRVHPGHCNIVRNTKSGLEEFGYKFPDRIFHAPSVNLDGDLSRFENSVERYLSEAYGRTEAALMGDGNPNLGFAKSTYYQRLVSSLAASYASLRNRREKLSTIRERANAGDVEILQTELLQDDDEYEVQDSSEVVSRSAVEIANALKRVASEAQIELSYLDDLLSMFSNINDDIASYDPKFNVSIQLLREMVPTRKVLVFSKYTDTIDSFVDFYKSNNAGLLQFGIAQYTGKSVWIERDEVRVDATKAEVVAALANDDVRVIFCSDAASEGLNLQSANVLINLDVPWNPARLEQRIGRIARLGQTSPTVDIFNLWYPSSIEAKMYSRLLERRDEYQLAVGEFPEIFSESISREIRVNLNGDQLPEVDPIQLLSEARSTVQRIALGKLWSVESEGSSISDEFRNRMLGVLRKDEKIRNSSSQLTEVPGCRNSLTPWSEELSGLDFGFHEVGNAKVEAVIIDSVPVGLKVGVDDGRNYLLKPARFPELVNSLLFGEPLIASSLIEISTEDLLSLTIENASSWMPNMSVQTLGVLHSEKETVSLCDLGYVNVA